MSDKSARFLDVGVRFARSVTKHRISRESIRYVIAHCGLCFEEPLPASDSQLRDRRLVYLDDAHGQAIEVIAVEGDRDDLIVIHAMTLRDKYRVQYEEAKQWQR
jgi:hypothetical protein